MVGEVVRRRGGVRFGDVLEKMGYKEYLPGYRNHLSQREMAF